QTATRGTCTSPSRHRTTPPTTQSPDADKDPASQTASRHSSSPPAAAPPAAAPSPSCPHASPPCVSSDTNPQRSAPSAAHSSVQIRASSVSLSLRQTHTPEDAHAQKQRINTDQHRCHELKGR